MAKQEDLILVVDDEDIVLEIVTERLSEEGYSCHSALNGESALEIMQNKSPSLVLTDYQMPNMNGLELIKKIKLNHPDTSVILMTAHQQIDIAVGAMKEGAYDYIGKPFDLDDLAMSVKRTLRHRKLEMESREYEQKLEKRVQERTAQLMNQIQKNRELVRGTLQSLIKLREAKHGFCKGHCQRVVSITGEMAKLAALSSEESYHLHLAAQIYNLGKIVLPDSLLHKTESLTTEEYQQVQKYVDYTVEILSSLEEFEPAVAIVQAHREQPDGKGYPQGLLGDEIPKGAKILGLVDSYVAMTSPRPYRPAKSKEGAMAELEKNSGTQFDKPMVSLFLEYLKRVDEK